MAWEVFKRSQRRPQGHPQRRRVSLSSLGLAPLGDCRWRFPDGRQVVIHAYGSAPCRHVAEVKAKRKG